MGELLLIAGIAIIVWQLPLAMLVGALLKNCREWEDQQRSFLEMPDAD